MFFAPSSTVDPLGMILGAPKNLQMKRKTGGERGRFSDAASSSASKLALGQVEPTHRRGGDLIEDE